MNGKESSSMTKGNFLVIIAVILVAIMALPAVIWSVYMIDSTVTSGEAYGFVIGDTKELATTRLVESSESGGWRIAYVRSSGVGLRAVDVSDLQGTDFPDTGYVLLVKKSGDIPLNSLRLTFTDGRLTTIRRNRRLFELP